MVRKERNIAQGSMGTAKLVPESELASLQEEEREVGKQVRVLASEGEPYVHQTVDLWGDGKERKTESRVPEGEVYIEVVPQEG